MLEVGELRFGGCALGGAEDEVVVGEVFSVGVDLVGEGSVELWCFGWAGCLFG